MQLTIDSGEPLEQVLAVVAAMYQVRLSVDDPSPAAAATKAPPTGSRRGTTTGNATAAAKPQPRNASVRPQHADPSTVRQWALATGVAVSDRGRVPRAVTEAYQAAQR